MINQSILQNRILAGLSAQDFAVLADQLEPIKTSRGMVLGEADAPIAFIHFLESGTASIVAKSPAGHQVETGVIGREGYVHPAVVLGADRAPQEIAIQLPGDSHRLACRSLLRAAEGSTTLRDPLLLFAQAHSVQLTSTIISNTTCHLDERLARWLLMCHDRSDSDDLSLTHDYMGHMLAVRRVSVTNALHVLEGEELVELARGCVVIRNRSALETYAGQAYGQPEAEYRRLFGSGRIGGLQPLSRADTSIGLAAFAA